MTDQPTPHNNHEHQHHDPFPAQADDHEQGDPTTSPTPHLADRRAKREHENRTSTPVIIKRWDQAVRHPDDTLEHAIEDGQEQANRTAPSLLLSAYAAGSILTFTALTVGVAATYAQSFDNPFLERLTLALVYPLGFVVCIMSGTQLFTEHTALAVYPVLERKITKLSLLRTWTLVLLGNYAGCLIGAAFLWAAEPVIHAAPGYEFVAQKVLAAPAGPTFISAMLAGWLMAIGGWLVMASLPNIGQMVSIYIVTFIIGLGGLHHSVAAAAELFAALFTGADISTAETAYKLTIVILGNLVGGSIFVAVLNYGHIRQTLPNPDDPKHTNNPKNHTT